jgi:hypothetical protein
MAYLTKIILPNNLRSESLRAEFLELGQNYNNNHSSEDPLYDNNSTTLKFKFEVRDAETRSTVYELTSIKELLISNDPEFTETSTYRIADFPASTYDPDLNYTITLNSGYFYGSGASHTSVSAAGTGFFIIEGWPLSGNGGLCTVYIKAILYVNDEDKDSKENIKYMKKICFDCPTYEPCLKWALLHEVYGMWAGTTEEERVQYRKDLNIAVIDPRYIDEYMQHQDDYKKSVVE